jgi:hypothetical protein
MLCLCNLFHFMLFILQFDCSFYFRLFCDAPLQIHQGKEEGIFESVFDGIRIYKPVCNTLVTKILKNLTKIIQLGTPSVSKLAKLSRNKKIQISTDIDRHKKVCFYIISNSQFVTSLEVILLLFFIQICRRSLG